jgi:hypothetical protein
MCTHGDCAITIKDPLVIPIHVLNLNPKSDSEDLCLYESWEGERSIYCTFSYDWPRNAFQTTQDTLDQLKKQVPVRELPKTIQDAITIARSPSFRYLWIDALCIAQDSKED